MNTTRDAGPRARLGLAILCAALLAACGGGDPEVQQGGRESTQAAVTSLAVPIAAEPDPMFDNLSIPADAATRGMWSATQPWPLNGLHAALMGNGKVATYGTPANTPGTQTSRTYDLWTPSLGFATGAHQTSFEATRLDSFCSTSTFLADGRLMITGGNGARQSTLVSPLTGATTTEIPMLTDQRWYATMVKLPDGRTVIVGGMDPYNENMQNNPEAAIANGLVSMTPEIFTPGTGWRTLPDARSREAFGPDYLRASYPRAWVAPDGRVFGISAEQMWSLDVNANGGLGAVQLHGAFKTPFSSTAPVNVGATSTAVMFAPGRILQVGGNGAFLGDDLPASNLATVIDINGASPLLSETNAMSIPRRYPNAVVLPDGKVVVTGGTRRGNNGGADAVFAAEIWNPATGAWTLGASAAQVRVYHSTTLLLPNGAVLSTGGGAPGPVNNQNAEIYYPPYLFRSVGSTSQLATRPVLTGINSLSFSHGGALQLELATSTPVSRLVLVANGLVTHSFNPSQRMVPVSFTQSGDRLSAAMPASANLAPPGYYQLFVLDAAGVPSRAVIVALGMNGTPTALAAVSRGRNLTLDSVSASGRSLGLDGTGLSVVKTLGSADLAGGQYTLRNGLADAACVSIENTAQPGRYLRRLNGRLQLALGDGSAAFNDGATFCPEAGSSAGSIRLRARSAPTQYVRARASGEVWVDTDDGSAAFRTESSFVPTPALAAPPTTPTFSSVAQVTTGSTARWAPGGEAAGLSFSWTFGDGSPATPYSASSAASHVYTQPGVYGVTLTTRDSLGRTSSRTFMQAVYNPPTAVQPRASSPLMLEPRSGASTRLWVVNPDNDSVSVFDTVSRARLAEIAVGTAPRSVALAPGGAVWVVNRDSASISILNAGTLTLSATVALPRASQPYGLVFSPDGSAAWVTLQATGQVARLNPASGATLSLHGTGPWPRQLAISGDSRRLLVSRFITGPLPGEGTASVATTLGGSLVGGEVRVFDTATMAIAATVVLRHSDRTDTEISGSGFPNYLGAASISPDGRYAWVPSKQDNVRRGTLRNGLNLDFQNTVRAISSHIDLGTLAELPARRVDHDNASVASAAAYDPTGAYLFVALETSRQVEVLDAARGLPLFRIEAGLAPQGLIVSADGRSLYVHNFMSRSVSVIDLSALTTRGTLGSTTVATLSSVASEKLAPAVLTGKQHFYDARDTRLARDAYLSCATCHHDGGHDGRTWDLSGFGEGLRNTIDLRGRAGMAQGLLHWSGNFDEVQDFEAQIRALAGGTGLMPDTLFNAGTRRQPLGDRKAGQSADLDALAAYVASLDRFAPSPRRNADGSLTPAAVAGRTVFQNAGCAGCHGGARYTISSEAGAPRSIGTIKPASGQRLGAALTGLDVPTLRDAWSGAPYLHDGSAATLAAAVQAHQGNTVAGADLDNLVAFLQQIGTEEPAVVTTAPASNLAPSATLATSYVSPWETLGAVNNNIVPANSADKNGGAYGNWQDLASYGRTDWVSFSWTSARTVSAFEVYWWSDGLGIATPTAARVEYWNGSAWVSLGSPGLALNTFNRLNFSPVTTTSVRVSMSSARATGILEARVWGTVGPTVNQPPTVSITAPAGGSSFAAGSTITLSATAADSDGSIARVEFYSGSTLLGTDTSAPYSLGWSGAAAGSHSLTARAIDNAGSATGSAAVPITVRAATSTGTGLQAAYYASNNLGGTAVLQRIEVPDFNWNLSAPATGLPADNFSIRWSGYLQAGVAGSYQIQTNSDDGVRAFVSGQRVIDNWTGHLPTLDTSAAFTLAAGQRVPIVVEYQELTGFAQLQLRWKPPGAAAFVVIPASQLYTAP